MLFLDFLESSHASQLLRQRDSCQKMGIDKETGVMWDDLVLVVEEDL